MSTNPNAPAFATGVYPDAAQAAECFHSAVGLTKREHFAALAMQGLLAQRDAEVGVSLPATATFAVMLADALIKALNATEAASGDQA